MLCDVVTTMFAASTSDSDRSSGSSGGLEILRLLNAMVAPEGEPPSGRRNPVSRALLDEDTSSDSASPEPHQF